jgi:hypothetical protein
MILAGLDKLISPESLWPGRADPMGLVLGLGLTTEEANIFPNRTYHKLPSRKEVQSPSYAAIRWQ